MTTQEELVQGLRKAQERLAQLKAEDEGLAEREKTLKDELAAAGPSDAEALAAVRAGNVGGRKTARAADVLQHEIETLAAARRAIVSEMNAAESEVASWSRSMDLAKIRNIGVRAVANGACIDRLLRELDEALQEGGNLYREALADRLVFRLGIQPQLMQHLAGSFRIGNALPLRLRELARSPFDTPHNVEAVDRAFFRQFDILKDR